MDKLTSWLKCYKAPSRLNQALAFCAKFLFLFIKATFHLEVINYFQKRRDIGSLVMSVWEKLTNHETHDRIGRVGRCEDTHR